MPNSRDLFKTQLCHLFLSKSGCHRQTCSFAHGEEELRRPPGRSYHSRDRFHSRGSPSRGGRSFDRRPYDRAETGSRSWSPSRQQPSRSLSSPRSTGQKRSSSNTEKEGDAKRQSRGEHLSDVSEAREAQSDPKEVHSDFLTEQLHKAEADLEVLDNHKLRLETALDNASQEIQRLLEKTMDLEARNASLESANRRLEKFHRGYTRYMRCQEDLKRLQKLVDEDEGHRRQPSPLFEGDHDNATKWKNRSSNGQVANGIPRKSHDAHEVTDNGSDGHIFRDSGF